MAVTVLQSNQYPPEFSTDNGATYRILVCAKDWHSSLTTATQETHTFCGVYLGLGAVSFTASGNAACKVSPETNELTFAEVRKLQQDQTRVKYRSQSPATGSVGSTFYEQGEGYFVNSDRTHSEGNTIDFSWEFKGEGVLDLTA